LIASNAAVSPKFDRTNAVLAGFVFVVSFVVYALTVQRGFSFWDCGEFIACAYSLGIPHPPGTPLFVILGRLAALIPFVEDISYRINYLSVISSAVTAMLSYLLTVRLVGYFFSPEERSSRLNRTIAYIGGVAGGFFVAFSRTNWANSVEAEVYGLALALSVGIVWLTLRYFEERGTMAASRTLILIFYLAMLGISVHMSVFLVLPVCAVFFVLKRDATSRDWLILCGFIILELLFIIVFSNGRGGVTAFYAVSAFMGAVLLLLLYKKINWALVIAIASVCSVMIQFTTYEKATVVALVVLAILGVLSKQRGWNLQWKTALAIVVIGFMGMSVHGFIPIRSSMNPRIDENNPSRDWRTFENFLDRKQYQQISMLDRMFKRRGSWANHFGRHAHMGFWSYFEEQYSRTGWSFIVPWFLLGMIGMITAIRKRLEIGLPFFTLFLVCSVGLILYMNFADGTKYNFNTGDAYLEVRNRDYFFTPAFVFFGIAMGVGVSAVVMWLKNRLAAANPSRMRTVVIASSVLALLPIVSLAHNYHVCDRSANNVPYNYAANILDTCEPNAILFTSGDNDTFPLWCIQEVYGYRLDVRVVNLSLLNTDWYVEQMKNRYGVPISLTDEQIVWEPAEDASRVEHPRPVQPFYDSARKRMTYLVPSGYDGRIVRVADMMVDHIYLRSQIVVNKTDTVFRQPIYFSSPPYAESPFRLRDSVHAVGMLYKLSHDPPPRFIDAEKGYELFMNTYRYDGYSDSKVYREENATGVFVTMGANASRVYDELLEQYRLDTLAGNFESDKRDKAIALMKKMIEVYPEYWQTHAVLADLYEKEGDIAAADQLWHMMHDSLAAFRASNKENLFYQQDLGLTKVQLGQRIGDSAMVEEGVKLVWDAFNANANSSYAFRKLVMVLARTSHAGEIDKAIQKFTEYKINQGDPFLQSMRGASGAPPPTPRGQPQM